MAKNKEKKVTGNSLWKGALIRLKRNKRAMLGLAIFCLIVLTAVLAPVIAPYGYDEQNIDNAFAELSREHLLGTDNLGRDILSRILYGGRISLILGIIAVAVAGITGGLIGTISGYYGGKVDTIIMRIMDVVQAVPNILLAIAIAQALGTGMVNCMIALGISAIPRNARLMRGVVLAAKDSEYVEAAKLNTASDLRIMVKHIVPNVMSPFIVESTMGYASCLLMAAALSFIGLGAQPPSPEWGAMITAGRQFIIQYPNMVTFPGIAIMLTVISLNLLGDGLRDALDPKMKQ